VPDDLLFLTVEEVSEILRVHPVTVIKMARRGDLPAVRIGRTWRIPAAAIRRLAGIRQLEETALGSDGTR
jgi:excisionase family DNA binding protein